MALQFPDFDPAAVTIPQFGVGPLADVITPIAAAAIAAASVGALVWRARRRLATADGQSADEGLPAFILWNAVRLLVIVACAVLALALVIRIFGLDHLGPFPVRWYALAYIAGILLGWRYCVGLVKNAKLWGARPPTTTPPKIDDLVLWVTLAIILGGRIGYILFYMLVDAQQRNTLAQNPAEVFEIWQGGMSFHGAAIGVGIAVIAFARANRIAILGVTDLVAACEPIGQCFGRLANFVNGELWGRVTTVPWGMNFCNARLMDGDHCRADVKVDGIWQHVARHPSQIYEAALEGVVLFLVLRFATHRLKWLQRPGAVTGLWLIGYGAIRIALENVRNPDIGMPNFPLGLTMGMILSIPMIVLGAALIWWAYRKAPPAPVEPAASRSA